MSDATMLKKLLEAENSSRGLIREAEEAAARRVHDALFAFQEDFRTRREQKIREIAAEEEKYAGELEELQKSRMAAFEEGLKNRDISFAAANREVRKILGIL